jgi:hypothetical protein
MPLAFSFFECPYEIFVQLKNNLFCFMTLGLRIQNNITTTKPHHVCLGSSLASTHQCTIQKNPVLGFHGWDETVPQGSVYFHFSQLDFSP